MVLNNHILFLISMKKRLSNMFSIPKNLQKLLFKCNEKDRIDFFQLALHLFPHLLSNFDIFLMRTLLIDHCCEVSLWSEAILIIRLSVKYMRSKYTLEAIRGAWRKGVGGDLPLLISMLKWIFYGVIHI